MGNYLVLVTYDLTQGDDFSCAKSGLEGIGLKDELDSADGKPVGLPNTTVAGIFPGSSEQSIRDWISPKVKQVMKNCKAKGKYFLLVTGTYSWIRETFDYH